jgi:carbamoyl-phosphate synthase large subunit
MSGEPRRVLVTAAGGAAGINFTRSLRAAPEPFHLIGTDANPYYLQRAETDERFLLPRADDPDYFLLLRSVAIDARAETVYSPPDVELAVISRERTALRDLGVRVFLPKPETVEVCHNKYLSYEQWRRAGLRVPATILLHAPADVAEAFKRFGPHVWLRNVSGGAGKGAFSASKLEHAREWIEYHDGWGQFVASAHLAATSVTWQSIWKDGALIVAQGRKRIYWEFGDRAPSGVTGLTGTGVTISDPTVDRVAQQAILAIDPTPEGIFSVDMTYDADGFPNPTEINIGRFFTTHLFFTRAGLNMPYILVKLALGEPLDFSPPLVNPLPAGLLWIRGMDIEPILTERAPVRAAEAGLQERRKRVCPIPSS